MKKIHLVSTLFLCSVLFVGCGGQKGNTEGTWQGIRAGMDDLSAITERTEYYDIAAKSEPIFHWEREKEDQFQSRIKPAFISMQFYLEEPVQLWREPNLGPHGELLSWDICLYRSDGSREAILQGIGSAYNHHGYLDQEGNLYWWKNSTTIEHSDGRIEKTETAIYKYSPTGKLLFEKHYDYGYDFEEIRQTVDGRIYLAISNRKSEGNGYKRLAELDPATGLVTENTAVQTAEWGIDSQRLGVCGEKLAAFKFQFLSGNEILLVNADDGAESLILSFQGTTYMPPKEFDLEDFRVMEDKSVEILWVARDSSKGLWEKLQMTKVNKIPIVLRGRFNDSWLAAQINSFNRQNETYHVILEDCGPGNDIEDFARLTSIQIISGKGPDILDGNLMEEYISGMMEKGILEDLRPYMERSGIREEDYFPFTFGTWKNGDRIYGVSPASPVLAGYCMDSAFLGSTQEPDLETLLDALLSSREDAVFMKGCDSQELLKLFLAGTDTLWGMVDWEKGSCDFSKELFAKILEAARLYGDSGSRGETGYIAQNRSFMKIFYYDDSAERIRNGKVICGVLFDDGCRTAVTSNSSLAVNTNSPHKEGAWEFIYFLLGDEAQSASSGAPASRKAFDGWVAEQKEAFTGGKEIHSTYANISAGGSIVITGETVYTEADITDEIIAEFRETLEAARPYPLRTVPILDIIRDEAEDYFNGSKSAEEAARLVTNRVQTYLDEGR